MADSPRDARDAEREKVYTIRDPFTRHDIHTLALRQEWEEVLEQAKLRVAGLNLLTMILEKGGLGRRFKKRIGE